MADRVKVQYHDLGICEITLEDRDSRNTFSSAFMKETVEAFKNIKPDTKVIIIHGYDNYFCCGGTQEELLNIFEGKKTFADLGFYRLLLDCEIPVIAAMQGHGLGGGLAFGCFADIIIMAEVALYSTKFMKYGFTPGMGSTYIVPKKLGEAVAHEMLYSAKNYRGSGLKQRGVGVNVVKQQEVLPLAFSLAKELADKPLVSLKLLKEHLTSEIRKNLPTVIEEELAMHEITFQLPETKERIKTLFGK